jgi:hypothetical protein
VSLCRCLSVEFVINDVMNHSRLINKNCEVKEVGNEIPRGQNLAVEWLALYFLYGSSRAQILAWRATFQNSGFCAFLHSIQTNSDIVPQITSLPLPSTSFPVSCSLITPSFDHVCSELWTAWYTILLCN